MLLHLFAHSIHVQKYYVQKTIPNFLQINIQKQRNSFSSPPLPFHPLPLQNGCLEIYRHEPPVTVVDTATYPLRNTPPNTGGMAMVGWESVGRFGEFRRSNGGCYQVGINRAKFSWLALLVAYRRKPSLFSSSLPLSLSLFLFSISLSRNDPKDTDLHND